MGGASAEKKFCGREVNSIVGPKVDNGIRIIYYGLTDGWTPIHRGGSPQSVLNPKPKPTTGKEDGTVPVSQHHYYSIEKL